MDGGAPIASVVLMAVRIASSDLAADLLREARPKQWLKNVVVFAAPATAGVLGSWPELGRALAAFVAMCLAASGTYFVNDVADVDADRRHPVKRERPVASGAVPIPLAVSTGVALALAGLLVAALTLYPSVVAVVATYLVATTAYSLWLKHVAVLDLATLAMMFVLRVVAGAAAAGVALSAWFVVCISFGAMFLAAGKRYAELREFGDGAAELRRALETYGLGFLRFVLAMAAAVTVLAYCFWAFDKADAAHSHALVYELSILPMATALLRYALLLDSGHGGAPEEVFLSDRALQSLVAIWVVLFVLSVRVA